MIGAKGGDGVLATYIQILLVAVPLVLLAAHWREAWSVLDRWFDRFDLSPPTARDDGGE